MKKAIIALILIIPALAFSQEVKSFQQAVSDQMSFNESRILALAEAIPAETYTWRPAEGVRSVSESLLHVASSNYFFFLKCGQAPPEDVDVMMLEKSTTDKAKIIEEVKKSFEYARMGIKAINDKSLGDKVEFPFPGEYNKQSAITIAGDHSAEHLGQLIAYARMNGVTPPWSKGGN